MFGRKFHGQRYDIVRSLMPALTCHEHEFRLFIRVMLISLKYIIP